MINNSNNKNRNTDKIIKEERIYLARSSWLQSYRAHHRVREVLGHPQSGSRDDAGAGLTASSLCALGNGAAHSGEPSPVNYLVELIPTGMPRGYLLGGSGSH